MTQPKFIKEKRFKVEPHNQQVTVSTAHQEIPQTKAVLVKCHAPMGACQNGSLLVTRGSSLSIQNQSRTIDNFHPNKL